MATVIDGDADSDCAVDCAGDGDGDRGSVSDGEDYDGRLCRQWLGTMTRMIYVLCQQGSACRGIYYWLMSSTFLPSFAHLLVENTTTTARIFPLGVDTTRKWRWCEVSGSTDKGLLINL